MPVQTVDFTTGPTTLPDVGELSYNGAVFSPLFETTASGVVVKDAANRTVRFVEYTITADGYVTAPTGLLVEAARDRVASSISTLRQLLTAQGGQLTYIGRGCELRINPAGAANDAAVTDVAWGPVPELIEFQPLGGGLSAKVRWQVKVRIPEGSPAAGGVAAARLLQFNYETVVSYDEAGYSSLSIKGTLEVPLTRSPDQNSRTLSSTVDDLRTQIDTRIMSGMDFSRFRVVRRNLSVSRDKRTLEWDFSFEEKPYMDLPKACGLARGTYSVRPAKAGMGLCLWLCTLRATYNVRADRPRRAAWWPFLALLRLRMAASALGNVPDLNGNQNPGIANVLRNVGAERFFPQQVAAIEDIGNVWKRFFPGQRRAVEGSLNAWLIDFNFDEGVYLDSGTMSFSATWRLVTTFSHIMLASGLWTKVPERQADGQNVWAVSMSDINSSQSWLPNRLDPARDIIVDFGGG